VARIGHGVSHPSRCAVWLAGCRVHRGDVYTEVAQLQPALGYEGGWEADRDTGGNAAGSQPGMGADVDADAMEGVYDDPQMLYGYEEGGM
jgi:hypothetical protein